MIIYMSRRPACFKVCFLESSEVVKQGVLIKSYKPTLRIVHPNSFSKTHTTIGSNLLLIFCSSIPSFVFSVLLKFSFTVLSGYFYNFVILYAS